MVDHLPTTAAEPGAAVRNDEYVVVVNHEEQYSIWATGESTPSGWTRLEVTGTRDECLDHIEKIWTDMRPLSLRQALDGLGSAR